MNPPRAILTLAAALAFEQLDFPTVADVRAGYQCRHPRARIVRLRGDEVVRSEPRPVAEIDWERLRGSDKIEETP